MKNLAIDVDALKEKNRDLLTTLDDTNKSLKKIEDFVESANSTIGAAVANPTLSRSSVLDLVHNETIAIMNRLDRLNVGLDTLGVEHQQMIKGLEDDVLGQKTKLDQLTENWANMTAQVVSVQNILLKLRENSAASAANAAKVVPESLQPLLTSRPSLSVVTTTETPKNAATLSEPSVGSTDQKNTTTQS